MRWATACPSRARSMTSPSARSATSRRTSCARTCIAWPTGSPTTARPSSSAASSPRVAPGDDRGAAARAHARARRRRCARILAELDTVVMPGIVHWGHPAFLGYFGSTTNGPGAARRDRRRRAQRQRDDVADVARRDRAGDGGARLDPRDDRPADDVHRHRLRHGVDRHAARAGGGARALRRRRSARRGLAGRARCADAPRLRVGPGAQLDREGDDHARPRRRERRAHADATTRSGMDVAALRERDRADVARGLSPDGGGRDRRDDVDGERRSGADDRRDVPRARRRGCTWTPRTAARWRAARRRDG